MYNLERRRLLTTTLSGAAIAFALVAFAACSDPGLSSATDSTEPDAVGDELRWRRCGNGVCSPSETCSTCPADCGTCRPPSSPDASAGDAAVPVGASGAAYPRFPSPSVATTGLHYYVATTGSDSNTGKDAQHAWRTIQHAATSITTGASGVTVHVAPGDYTGAVTVSLSGSSFNAPVRFQSDVRWGARLDAGGAGIAWGMNGAYQEMVGFDIRNAAQLGIAYKASHVRVLANRVHDLASNACNSQGGAAIDTDSYAVTDAEVDDNVIFAIGPGGGNTKCNTVQGIYFATADNKAYNNLCSNVSGSCISTWHGATHLTLVNNTVMNSQSSGIVVGCGDSGCTLHDNSYVANNISVNNGAYGIQETGVTGTNNRYVNNLIFGNVYFGRPVGITLQNGLTASGTIAADPLFVNDTRSVTTGDYHLKPNSPAVDKGTSTNAWPFDFDGVARPSGAAFDLGAFEWHP
jgi:hypothetical protein